MSAGAAFMQMVGAAALSMAAVNLAPKRKPEPMRYLPYGEFNRKPLIPNCDDPNQPGWYFEPDKPIRMPWGIDVTP